MAGLWWSALMLGGPLDGATVCVPCRGGRVDRWVWAHECVWWDGDEGAWRWAAACVSGFYVMGDDPGSFEVDAKMATPRFEWRDVRFMEPSWRRDQFGL